MSDARVWKAEMKPAALECPREFCFLWDTSAASCGCPFGLCTRLDSERGKHDFYEPHEPNLARAGLPWFYFIPDADKLANESKEEYEREAKRLWG